MIVAYARALRADLDDQLQRLDQGIVAGASDWVEYREMLGQRRGLLKALAAIDEISRRFDQAE